MKENAATLTKLEAIKAMGSGKRVTHHYFTNGEWMTIDLGKIVFEDGVRCSIQDFYADRQSDAWGDGYRIVEPASPVSDKQPTQGCTKPNCDCIEREEVRVGHKGIKSYPCLRADDSDASTLKSSVGAGQADAIDREKENYIPGRLLPCFNCGGRGSVVTPPTNDDVTCKYCKGTGEDKQPTHIEKENDFQKRLKENFPQGKQQVAHTPGEWREKIYSDKDIDIIEDMSGAEFSSGGDIVCHAPTGWAPSMKHWERRKKLILSAPSLLADKERLEKENEQLRDINLKHDQGVPLSEKTAEVSRLAKRVEELTEALTIAKSLLREVRFTEDVADDIEKIDALLNKYQS